MKVFFDFSLKRHVFDWRISSFKIRTFIDFCSKLSNEFYSFWTKMVPFSNRSQAKNVLAVCQLYILWYNRNKKRNFMFDLWTSIDSIDDGKYHKLIKNMWNLDPETHFRYFRMDSAASFDELLTLVELHISHAATHKMPVGPAERLAVTLR